MRPTHIKINFNALLHNLKLIRKHVNHAQIMAIVKAEAYGHGLIPIAQKLVEHGVEFLGVAFPEEGIALRKSGINIPILVLGGVVEYQVQSLLDHNLDIAASSLFKAQLISRQACHLKRKARIHIKIDTGMGRIGVKTENAIEFVLQVAQMKNLELVGIFSHFAQSEGPDLTTAQSQHEKFQDLIFCLQQQGIEFPLIHLANSAALYNFPQGIYNMVRPGLTLYGYAPAKHLETKWSLQQVMEISTEIVFFKGIRANTGIGYSHTWSAPQDGWLATLPIGYGDGYPRILSNRSQVLIAGKRYPIVGNISMDQMTVWLEQDCYEPGEKVILMGKQSKNCIDAWELAAKAQTIPYEILCNWAQRVPRVYVQ